MNYEDVQKVSNAAKAKSNLVNTNFFKYFVRAVMAGFFIDMAMIYSNVVGNVFSKTTPESEVERMIKELEQLPPVPSEGA